MMSILSRYQATLAKPAKSWLYLMLCMVWAGSSLISDRIVLANHLHAQSSESIYLKGQLVPRYFVKLAFGAATRVDQVLVKEGDRVEVGDILIRSNDFLNRQADLAKAEFVQTQAEIALKVLYDEAEIALAQANGSVANAVKGLALAEDRVESLRRSHSQDQINQAYANLLLAEQRRDQVGSDLQIAQQQYRNKAHILWKFINQRQFRLRITLLEVDLANAERKVVDARKKYANLTQPVDAIDLRIAEAELATAQASLRYARSEKDKKVQLPDPDKLEVAQARLNAAQASVSAAQAALDNTLLKAPMSGSVVELSIKTGEWIAAGKTLITIADLTEWTVETQDLTETLAPQLIPGQAAQISFWAYPELSWTGKVEKIGLNYREEDGEITYALTLSLDGVDPRFAWGMTADILFVPGD